MKDHSTLFLAATALILLFTGCTKESVDGGNGIPMRVAPSLDVGTKASITQADLTEFYLQMDCADAAFSYFGKLTKSGTGWAAGKQLLWKNETTPVSYSAAFFAGHAFTASEFAAGVNLAVPANQSTQAGLNSADLLTLPAADIKYEDTAGGVLPVTLSHGLTKVNFVLTLGGAFYDAGLGLTGSPVTAFKVNGANTGFNFKPHTGVVTVTGGTQADITPRPGTYTPGTAASKAATATFEAILVPQTFAAGALSVSFSVGLGNYTWTNASAITLSAGTTVNLTLSATTPKLDPYTGHAYVDMGTGLKWATCNVGATNPDDYGSYFAWGETAPKADYSMTKYFDRDPASGSYPTFMKYTTGKKTVLEPEDDAATVNWGGRWRMATVDEWNWLKNNCTWVKKTTAHGYAHDGVLITSNVNGNSIFLPGAGFRPGTDSPHETPVLGYYWTCALQADSPYCASAYMMRFYADYDDINPSVINYSYAVSGYLRFDGLTVRPVAN